MEPNYDVGVNHNYEQNGNKRQDDNITQVSETKVTYEPLNKVIDLETLDL